MNLDKAILRLAACVILCGLALGVFVHPAWLLLVGLAGANMFQASFTGFCPAVFLFKKLGIAPGRAFE